MKKHQSQDGSSMVEFAIALPLLALLLFGIIQWGFIFAAHITLRNASAVAARYAVLGTSPGQSNIAAVAQAAITPMLDPAKLQTPIIGQTNLTGSVLATNVTLRYNLPLIIPFVVPGKTTDGSLTISATTIMR